MGDSVCIGCGPLPMTEIEIFWLMSLFISLIVLLWFLWELGEIYFKRKKDPAFPLKKELLFVGKMFGFFLASGLGFAWMMKDVV